MAKKIRVGILFGGRSAEHEVSLQSAKNVIEALDRDRFEPVLIGIGKQGCWYLSDASEYLLHADDPKLIELNKSNIPVTLLPSKAESGNLVNLNEANPIGSIDVVFPVLHGPYGEDGTMQGLLKLADLPFVGAGVLGSAVAMDKDVTKRLLRDAGMRVAKFLVFSSVTQADENLEMVERDLGFPVFVKPANLGSSVGINKAHDRAEFEAAVAQAFEYDRKVLVEEFVEGREIECSVLGNEDPIASLPGEIVSDERHGFYSYDAKYIDEKGAELIVPAELAPEVIQKIQEAAIEAFKILCCEGMARVDMFITPKNEVVLSEINTIPGFTKISMYPRLWGASGVSYTELITRLIELALARHKDEEKLKTSY